MDTRLRIALSDYCRRCQMTLILMRHAEASSASSDRDRPLTRYGRSQAKKMASRFLSRSVTPDLILVSSAHRTQETGAIILETLSLSAPVRVEPALYTGMEDDYLAAVSRTEDSYRTVLLIGHNPSISGLATVCAGFSVAFDPADAVFFRPAVDSWSDFALTGSDRMDVFQL